MFAARSAFKPTLPLQRPITPGQVLVVGAVAALVFIGPRRIMQRIRETVDVTKEVLEESEKAAAAASAKKANADQQQQQIDSAHKEAANKSDGKPHP